MLDSYRRVLGHPGAVPLSIAGVVGRLPISMVTLGTVLLVQSETGSYGFAGMVSATTVVAQAAVAIVHGRLIDTYGQSRVLLLSVTVFAAALSMMTAAVVYGWPRPVIFAMAALAGMTMPQIGACARARWSFLLDRSADKQTAFALEAVYDETVFIIGPVLATTLAVTWHPLGGLAVAIAAAVAGTFALVAQRSTEPPASRVGAATQAAASRSISDPRPGIPWRVVLPIGLVGGALGTIFGATEVATVAFAEAQGTPAAAGWMLAAWALGSLSAGLVSGGIDWRRGPDVRVRWGALAILAAIAPLPFIGSVPVMVVVMLLGGSAIAPTLVATFSVVEQAVPKRRLTEGMGVLSTGVVGGIAPGAALAGFVVDHFGASSAYAVSIAAGLLAVVAAQGTRLHGAAARVAAS